MLRILKNLKFWDKRWLWIILGLATILLTILAGNFPARVEQLYSRAVFPVIRKSLDMFLGWSPIPWLYIFILFLLLGGAFYFLKLIRKKSSIWKKLLDLGFSLLALAGGLVFFFQLLWGLNYQRIPLEEQLGFSQQPIDSVRLEFLLQYSTEKVVEHRAALVGDDTSAIGREQLPGQLEDKVLRAVNQAMEAMDLPGFFGPRARQLWPEGVLLRFSTSGFYFPFTGECNLDRGLHPLQQPFVMAHEFGHAFGFGDEGTCNFLGFISTINSEDTFIQYTGWLGLWRYIVRDFRSAHPERYREIFPGLPVGALNDWEAIRLQMTRFPDIMPRFRDLAYQTYLHSQGVRDGLKSYNRVVNLADAWLRTKGNK
jgi:hypothetical protein